MAIVKSKPGLISRFNKASPEVRSYFKYIPKLVRDFPLDVCLSYVFSRVELAQNMTLYCGMVKLHRAEATLARKAVDVHHMTRTEFRSKFHTVFGRGIPDLVSKALSRAEGVRDRVMHGKATPDDAKRNAIADVIGYAEKLNAHVSGLAGFEPFGDLRGFKGAGKSLDKSTTRWILKGMGFNLA